MYDIPLFFGAAAGGFILMAAIGVQAAVALFSSVPLTRRHKELHPDFNAKKAYIRVAQVSILTSIFCALITAVIYHFTSTPVIMGFGLGFILAFLMNLKRMSPDNQKNQHSYEKAYADCYPFSSNPDDVLHTPSTDHNHQSR